MFDQLRAIMTAGGPVMFVLLILSLVSVTLTLERIAFWLRHHGPKSRRTLGAIGSAIRSRQPAAAGQLAREHFSSSIYARFAADLLGDRLDDTPRPSPIPESAALELIERYRPAVERWGTALAAIVAAAPLLGILGTVLGIIQSFDLLGQAQVVTDPTAVAAGIAQALYTTAFGLIVALLTLFPYAVFRTQSERCLARLESLAVALSEG